MKLLTAPLSAVLALAFASAALAAPPTARPAVHVTVTPDRLTPRARGELARQFVRKWGAEVQRRYDVPVRTWARRTVPMFVKAHPTHFRAALARDTLEGALAELMGQGGRVSDASVRAEYARAAKSGTKAAPLGALHTNLTFTAVKPCRLVDTRNTQANPLPAGSTTGFVLFGADSYVYSGGADENCGLPIDASAMALNVTVVFPDRAGYATLYPNGSDRPLASSINYAAGSIVNNTVVTAVPNPFMEWDADLYTYAAAHFVIDVVGYYRPTAAKALDCNIVTASTTVVSMQPFDVEARCAAGDQIVGGSCSVNHLGAVRWMLNGVTEIGAGDVVAKCSGYSVTSSAPDVVAHARCCRVTSP